jgi:hypothetical protein
MRRFLAVVGLTTAVGLGWAPAAFACGGLVAPNGAVKLLQTTTLVAYHDGVEHYVTSFAYEGGGGRFGSIVPLPGVPTSVTRGGSWTLQRLEREVQPPVREPLEAAPAASAGSNQAQVILRAKVDALNITVIKGGGPAVTAWVRQQGFAVSRDLPAMLDFYAHRSPIFLTATFDGTAEAARHLQVGDGTPVQVAVPTPNPWVPLHILSLAKDLDDVVTADVFMLTDHRPALLSGPGVHLVQSRPAEASLLSDLRSDRGMSWIAPSAWFSYLNVDAPAGSLSYDLAADTSGAGHPSRAAAALIAYHPGDLGGGPGDAGSNWWWVLALTAAGLAILLATIWLVQRRRRPETPMTTS